MSEQPLCEICGEPMPESEQMFKYHGASGPEAAPAACAALPQKPTGAARRTGKRSMQLWL